MISVRIFAAAALAWPLLAQADFLQVSDAQAAAIRPPDGTTVQQTPPDFSWPEISKQARYTVNLRYPDGRTRSLAAPQNYLNWNEVLPAGRYSWTVTMTDSGAARTSEPRSFVVDQNSKPFLVPDMKALL